MILKNSLFKELIIKSLLNAGLKKREIGKLLSVKYDYVKRIENKYVANINFNFGVEIETQFDEEIKGLPKDFKMFYKLGYHVTPNDFDINNQYHWRQMYDGSIGCYGEYISPILQGKTGLKILETFCKCLKDSGATTDLRCGLHIHIDKNHFKSEHHIIKFETLYSTYEEVIDEMVSEHRRKNNNRFCKSIKSTDRDSKYRKVNLLPKKTVEIRHPESTLDFSVISGWLSILNALINAADKYSGDDIRNIGKKTIKVENLLVNKALHKQYKKICKIYSE